MSEVPLYAIWRIIADSTTTGSAVQGYLVYKKAYLKKTHRI